MLGQKYQEIIAEFNWEHAYGTGHDCGLVEKLRKCNLTDEQLAQILLVIESTCKECWNNNSGCQCWNDD